MWRKWLLSVVVYIAMRRCAAGARGTAGFGMLHVGCDIINYPLSPHGALGASSLACQGVWFVVYTLYRLELRVAQKHTTAPRWTQDTSCAYRAVLIIFANITKNYEIANPVKGHLIIISIERIPGDSIKPGEGEQRALRRPGARAAGYARAGLCFGRPCAVIRPVSIQNADGADPPKKKHSPTTPIQYCQLKTGAFFGRWQRPSSKLEKVRISPKHFPCRSPH
jgi:hypothetical protein